MTPYWVDFAAITSVEAGLAKSAAVLLL